MKKIKINVKGMHCPSCEMLIKESLEETAGVKNAELSHKNETATVTYDETKISEKEIKKIIQEEGYKV